MKLICLLLAAGIGFAQTSVYPGALDSDSTLFITADNVPTTLNVAMATTDNVAIVRSGTGFVNNMIVTICDVTAAVATGVTKCTAWEHMLITAANGQSLTVTRGVAGTSARSHATGAVISALIDAAHQQSLKAGLLALETTLGANLQGMDPGPAWPTFNTNWASFMRNVNNYPPNAFFANGTNPLPEAIRGAINIPANSASGTHGAGVAGYASTSSNTKGAVGVFGFGGVQAAGASAWGGNFLVTNSLNNNSQTGYTNTIMYGIEIDTNMEKLPGGAQPNTVLRGISIIGASEVKPPLANAIDVDSLGFNQTPELKWDAAYRTEDGAATNALEIGTAGAGNGVGSQTIAFHMRDAGGNSRQASILVDGAGNLDLNPASGSTVAQIILADGNGNEGMALVPNGSTPWIAFSNQARFAQYAFASLPGGIGPGTAVYCTNCTLAATCAAGGSGHLALYNGTNWTCQ